MISAFAEKLINDLRFDAHTRRHFSITAFSGAGTCGTVGCIAGTAIYRAFPEVLPDGSNLIVPDHIRRGSIEGNNWATDVELGAHLLGIDRKSSAQQLFLPWEYWESPLILGDFGEGLSHNERPDLTTVEKMIAFAKDMPLSRYHPTHCANALENLLKHERAYVDWAEAWEEP
ncbi:MAG: hypothetical protein KGL39_04810 [Patescibacteria group bacterium]|nr:hypothetical protein [Patescibacteria group bacterium]